ncbi:MAG: UDP-2,3-diacylglucosamine diphosphatase [Burkholderiales bacterium]
MKPTLFISDLHLSPARPALVAAFESFCAAPARAAAGLYVLGDLFDQWVGDDQLREPMAARIAAALRGVADSGVPVGIIVGNRDFLMGKRFADAAGATLLPEQIVVDVAGTPTLLMHGDELCTSDVAYQRFRRISHDRRWQRSFLALPYAVRRGVANWLRRKSREATANKPEDILDVESSAVDTAFRKANVARIVHGHTHRPAHHRLVVDGRACERYVLADWYDRGTYLEFDADGGRKREF